MVPQGFKANSLFFWRGLMWQDRILELQTIKGNVLEGPQFCPKMKRVRLTRAGPRSSNLQCSLLIFSVFNELQRVGAKRATDGSPFETCCLCEVLGWSPEQKSMFMTYYKHTHIQCSVLPFKLQQGLIARHGTQHTQMLKKGFRRFHTPAVIFKCRLGIVVFCQLCVIFCFKKNMLVLEAYCTQTYSEKAKSRGRTNKTASERLLCCLKWCLLILHTAPSATLSHAG